MSLAKPKVAFVTSRFPFDGKEPFLHAELAELSRCCDVSIIPVASWMRGPAFPLSGMNVARQYAPFSRATFSAALREIARHPRRVLAVLREVLGGPRNIGAKMRNVLIFPKALAVAELVRKAQIRHIHAYWLSTPSTVAYVSSRLCGVSWSATGHRWDLADGNLRTTGRPSAGFFNSARFVRTISRAGARLVSSALGEANAEKVKPIYLGVNVPHDSQPSRIGRSAPEFRLACIASLVPVKGHAYLLAALKRVKESGTAFHCTLFGDGPLRRRLIRIVARLGLQHSVEITGRLPHAEVLRRLHAHEFDAAILTSVDEGIRKCEGIPVSLMETMAAGIPCIATRSGSVPELVNDTNGILVDAHDVDALAAAILHLAGDDELCCRLGEQARACVESEFFVGRTAAQLAALILPPASAGAATRAEPSGLERFAPAAT